MRLLNVRDPNGLRFDWFPPDSLPKYAIASHRWADEVSLSDVQEKKNTHKTGYKEIEGFARYVRDNLHGIDHFWYDSCCIDQKSSAELSGSINSMFRYYREAAVCLAYLADVQDVDDEAQFRNSVWHTRGWTLQELLAPSRVVFLSHDWRPIGYKGDRDTSDERPSLEPVIASTTGIPELALKDYKHVARFSFEEKLQWSKKRSTLRAEDKVYCLIGLFDVTMPVIYGEGHEKARSRMFAEMKRTDPEAGRQAISVIPHAQNQDFVERSELSDQINVKMSTKAARIALVGLGGVGKTQLALEYAYRTRETDPLIWVLWLHASNLARLEASAQEVVQRLRLPGYQAPDIDVAELLRGWLCDDKNGKWLLILDNVDDATVLFTTRPVRRAERQEASNWMDYIPVCEHGSVLVTSKSRSDARRLVPENCIIDVEPMDTGHAETLLVTKLSGAGGPGSLHELAEALDCMPLALSQAAAYIRQRKSTYTIQRYLDELLRNKRKRIDLLTWDPKLLDRDREASSSILLTWQISFEYIRGLRKSAADLLSLMSLCDRQAIPKMLISETPDEESGTESDGEDMESMQSARDSFEDDIMTLEDFAFITATTSEHTWQMHRLVQDATRIWLTDRAELETWKGNFLDCLARVAPANVQFEKWHVYRKLYPHVKQALDLKPTATAALLGWAEAMHVAGWYALSQGNFNDAELMTEASMMVRLDEMGPTDPGVLAGRNNLGTIYFSQGDLAKAQHTCEEVLAAENELPPNHKHRLLAKHNLAEIYQEQGRHEDAESLATEVLKAYREDLGEDHPDVPILMRSLADVYVARGKYREAEPLYQDGLSLSIEICGEGHLQTLEIMDVMARLKVKLGKYKEAEKAQRRVLEACKMVLDHEHPRVLSAMDGLAHNLLQQGHHREAENLHRQVLSIRSRVSGHEHPDTLASMNNLALVLSEQDRQAEAEEMQRQILSIRRKVLSDEHPHILQHMNNLAHVLAQQTRYQEAEGIYRQVLDTRKKTLSDEHPDTIVSKNNLAAMLWAKRELHEAEPLMRQAVEEFTKLLGAEHGNTKNSVSMLEDIRRDLQDQEAESLSARAGQLYDEEKYQEAEDLYRKALQMRRQIFGDEDSLTLLALHDLSMSLWKSGQLDEAKYLLDQAIAGRARILGEEHEDTVNSKNEMKRMQGDIQLEEAASMQDLASDHYDRQDFQEAERLYRQAYQIHQRVLGDERRRTLRSLHNVAMSLWMQGKLKEAEQLMVEAAEGQTKLLGSEDEGTMKSVRRLEDIRQEIQENQNSETKLTAGNASQTEGSALQGGADEEQNKQTAQQEHTPATPDQDPTQQTENHHWLEMSGRRVAIRPFRLNEFLRNTRNESAPLVEDTSLD